MQTFQYTPIQFFEREYGIEYTKYEFSRMREVYEARSKKLSEVSGYVAWLRVPKMFLILPTLTSPNPCIICEISKEMQVPLERAFIRAKGTWRCRGAKEIEAFNRIILSAEEIFTVDHYEIMIPEIDQIKQDINYHDFKGILFDAWSNVDEPIQDLIAHSIVSSPKMFDRRGGLTLSLYNEFRISVSKRLVAHLRRFIPTELRQQRQFKIKAGYTGHVVKLDPFPWMYKSINADEQFSTDAVRLLNRHAPLKVDEITLSLYSNDSRPKSLREPPVTESDSPIVIKGDVEKRPGFYDSSFDILKFIISSHIIPPPVMSQETYSRSVQYLQEQIDRLAYKYPILADERGSKGLLDLNIHGKPESLLHLALSDGRSNMVQEIEPETVKTVFNVFEKNMDNTMVIWQEAFPEKGKLDYSSISPEQRRIIGYIIEHGPSSFNEIRAVFNDIQEFIFEKLWRELHDKGAIYEKQQGIFDVAKHYKNS